LTIWVPAFAGMSGE